MRTATFAKILQPLGMQHTLARQPPADKLPAEMSKGYKWQKGRFEAQGFEYVPAAPAGCISTTAADVAKFMLAHLHDGQLGAAHILKCITPWWRWPESVSSHCFITGIY